MKIGRWVNFKFVFPIKLKKAKSFIFTKIAKQKSKICLYLRAALLALKEWFLGTIIKRKMGGRKMQYNNKSRKDNKNQKKKDFVIYSIFAHNYQRGAKKIMKLDYRVDF